ncbi:MAG: glycosyltransferase family 2 protein [Candidatus Nanopelagicaceae bacterium]|nr:glycosyltransferase family 2 protein [Candidatus Nanopelagicaceae bacterium]
MIFALLLFPSIIALISLANQFSLIRLTDAEKISPLAITVLVPLRNEEKNVEAVIASLKKQRGLPHFSIVLIDDNSTDQTRRLCSEAISDDSRFSLLVGSELPIGWLGKPFALKQGLELCDSELIILIDADVRLKENALSEAATIFAAKGLDFISVHPKEIALTWSERLIQPLLQWSWIASVPLKIAERSSRPSLAIANGQFFLLRKASLVSVGGFDSIRNEVIDDIALARVFLKSGFHGTVVDGSRVAECRMYQSWEELRNGYSKSLPVAFGGPFGSCLVVILLFLTGVLPLGLTLTGSTVGLIALALIYVSRLLSARVTGGRRIDAIAHPLSSLLLIYLIVYSWRTRGKVLWKGRTV